MPQATTGQPPNSLFLGRSLLTRFDLLHPDIESKVVQKQAAQKTQHDIRTRQRQFTIGQAVMVKNLRPRGDQWIPGVIVRQSGPVTYHVDVGEGMVWKRHQDHVKFRDLPDPEADLVSPQAESDLDYHFNSCSCFSV